jgi:hypothetical protein
VITTEIKIKNPTFETTMVVSGNNKNSNNGGLSEKDKLCLRERKRKRERVIIVSPNLFRVRNEEMERAEAEECRELGKRQDRKSHVRYKLQINTIKIHFKNNTPSSPYKRNFTF